MNTVIWTNGYYDNNDNTILKTFSSVLYALKGLMILRFHQLIVVDEKSFGSVQFYNSVLELFKYLFNITHTSTHTHTLYRNTHTTIYYTTARVFKITLFYIDDIYMYIYTFVHTWISREDGT